MPKVEYVAYGLIADMIAEYGAFDMGEEWFAEYGYTHCALVIGDTQFDTEYATSEADARDMAKAQADYFNVRVIHA